MDLLASFLVSRAGYWSLIAFDFELVALIVILWRRTRWAFFERWLRRLSWLLPSFLWWGYYYRWPIPQHIAIHSIEDFLRIQTRLFFRDSEVLAALLIPWLSLAVATAVLYYFAVARRYESTVETASRRA